ncbi:hypothetical protein ACF0H5_001992 [Mactra antiquata]
MSLNTEDERKLRRNWSLLKQELRLEELIHKFVEDGIFPPNMRSEIMNIIPTTPNMQAEKFLNSVIACGDRGYTALCDYIRSTPDNRYSCVVEALGLGTNNTAPNSTANRGNNTTGNNIPNNNVSAVRNVELEESRPSTAVSSTSSGTINSETGEKHRRIKNIPREVNHEGTIGAPQVAMVAPVVSKNQQNNQSSEVPFGNFRQTGPDATNGGHRTFNVQSSLSLQSEMSLQSFSSTSTDYQSVTPIQMASGLSGNDSQNTRKADTTPQPSNSTTTTPQQATTNNIPSANASGKNTPVDMHVLEQELVRMAPAIADLFKKISIQTSSNIPTSEEELQKVKEENERLRKTNKTLIEKLNTFQQKIIQLQLDNKKLKENGDTARGKKEELAQKATELRELEKRLDDHKKALEEKEQELNTQLLKLKEIEEENEEQRQKIDKLEELQDEGIVERNIQQEQISTLVEEKEKQRDQIDSLEEQQKMGEQRLLRLEQRLNQLEQAPGPRRQGGRNRRVMSPPRNAHWMNGVADRSHHANVKFHSEIKFNPGGSRTGSQGKAGWPFI